MVENFDKNCSEIQLVNPQCVSCKPGFVMKEDGSCTACSTRTYDKGCMICDPINDAVCIMCRIGYYQTSDGECHVGIKEDTKPEPQTPVDDSKNFSLI